MMLNSFSLLDVFAFLCKLGEAIFLHLRALLPVPTTFRAENTGTSLFIVGEARGSAMVGLLACRIERCINALSITVKSFLPPAPIILLYV
jgi:hypothetical protein